MRSLVAVERRWRREDDCLEDSEAVVEGSAMGTGGGGTLKGRKVLDNSSMFRASC